MLRDLLRIQRDPLGYLQSTVDRFGDVVAFPLPRTPVLLINEPQGVRQILVDNARNYSKDTVQYGALSAVTGAGLLTTDGAQWRRRRRIARPAFHHGTLDGVAAEAVRAAERVVGQWSARCDGAVSSDGSVSSEGAVSSDGSVSSGGAVVDVDSAVMRATLEVVGRTLFDADLAADGERIVRAVHDALDVVVRRARRPRPAWLPSPSARRLGRAVRTLDVTCARVVAARRARGVEGGDDLLGLLLRSAGPGPDCAGLSDREIRDELVTLVIAGHETVASSLTWALQLLAENVTAQDEVAAEVASVLGGRDPGWADLPALTFTRQVVDEALRLYPPAWLLTRRAVAADVVAGVSVPAGTLLIISPWLLQRRPQAWLAPTRFDPGRFAAPRSAAPRGDYLPFGWGPRLCIGRDFALVEVVLMLATVVQRVRLDVVRHGGVAVRPQTDPLVTLRPRGGLRLVVTPRTGRV
jgi:cytochrome P450